MPSLTESRIAAIVQPYLGSFSVPATLYPQLSAYLDLLLKWNARTNLTAIRDPEQIVTRHFGESLFAGAHLATKLSASAKLLDFGSGAGFPGLPIQLLLPSLQVTLAESQNKKATFLREVIRNLGLRTTVHAARVETIPDADVFDAVTLRAVDNMEAAIAAAKPRLAPGGCLVIFSAEALTETTECYPMPNSSHTFLCLQHIS
jgi:16S rRNA (guanine527-N7)-methyltransferase